MNVNDFKHLSTEQFIKHSILVRNEIVSREFAGQKVTEEDKEQIAKDCLEQLPDVKKAFDLDNKQVAILIEETLVMPEQLQKHRLLIQETMARLIIVMSKYQLVEWKQKGVSFAEIQRNVSQKHRKYIPDAMALLISKEIIEKVPGNSKVLYRLNIKELERDAAKQLFEDLQIVKRQKEQERRLRKKAYNKRYRITRGIF